MKKQFLPACRLLFCMAVIFVPFLGACGSENQKESASLTVEALSDQIRETETLSQEHGDRTLILPSQVIIRRNGVSGCGSIYEVTADSVIIVTAGHVLAPEEDGDNGEEGVEGAKNAEDTYVTFFSGKELPCRILDSHSPADVGFVAVKASDLTEEDRNALRRVRIGREAYEKLAKNDLIFMADIKRDEPLLLEGGVVEKDKELPEFSVPMLYGDGGAVAGMSGSGVFDEEGYYIGMLVAATEYGELAILPVTEIEAAR